MKKLFLLPLVAMFGLVGCGQNAGGAKSALQKAFEAGVKLEIGKTSDKEYTFKGVVAGVNSNTYFLYDSGYGMMVYGGSIATTGLEVGKVITVTSAVTKYNNVIETSGYTAESYHVEEEEGQVPEAIVIDSLAKLQATRQNLLINFTFEIITPVSGWSSSGKAVQPAIKVGNDTIKLALDKYSYKEAYAEMLAEASAGDKFTVSGGFTTAYDKTNDLKGYSNQLYFAASSTLAAVAA